MEVLRICLASEFRINDCRIISLHNAPVKNIEVTTLLASISNQITDTQHDFDEL